MALNIKVQLLHGDRLIFKHFFLACMQFAELYQRGCEKSVTKVESLQIIMIWVSAQQGEKGLSFSFY